jgi:transcriptional regulator with XRE-family HTH domain
VCGGTVADVVRRSRAHVALGRVISSRRAHLSLSQEELADRVEISRYYLGGIERGEQNPSFSKLLCIAEALRVELSTLIKQAEEMLDGGEWPPAAET